MRKLLLSTAILALMFSCNSEKPAEVQPGKLSGTIPNMEDQVLLLRVGEDIDSVKINSEGVFTFEKEFSKPVNASLSSGRKAIPLYLKNGFDLAINTSKSNFGKEASFSGKGSEENTLLQKDQKIVSESKMRADLYKLSMDNFTAKSDSVMKAEIALVSGKEEVLDPDFVEWFLTDVKYRHLNYYNNYERAHKYYAQEDAELSDKAKNLIEAAKVDSDKMVGSDQYVKFMSTTLEQDFKSKNGIEDYIENPSEFFNWLSTNVKSEKLRNEILFANSKYSITYVNEEDRDQIYNTFSKINTDKEYQKKIDETYAKFESLRKGMPAPKWSYPTLEGEQIGLDDLKGKLVYIDVWATWCGPCKAEIPALAKLHQDYKDTDLTIISVSVDDNKKAWEKMLAEEGFEWLQVHAEKAWKSEIIKENQIRGIPRFMLVDKEGNIISVNAPRPSSENIREYLESYL